MNNGGKNIKQAAILGVLFLALVIVGIMQFRGSANPATPPAPVANTPAADEKVASTDTAAPAEEELTETTAGALGWVKEKRLPGMSEEAKMRNPFQSFMDKAQASGDAQVATADSDAPAPAPAPITRSQLIIPDKNLGRLPVYGNNNSALPVAPLQVIPPFKLVSINTDLTAKVNYALVELNGDYYTLRVGEKIPNVDWAVKSIDTLYKKIVLTKKNSEPVILRISGGNDK